MEKGVVNPKVQALMGRDSSFASEQRPTGYKVSFLKFFFFCVLHYIKILGGIV